MRFSVDPNIYFTEVAVNMAATFGRLNLRETKATAYNN